ncbi:MAG: hypothetical protein NXI15_09290 [Gammaproteobacteria bacterium]|nr:hypothetical protein [Gammaproteobacteria bacterium]
MPAPAGLTDAVRNGPGAPVAKAHSHFYNFFTLKKEGRVSMQWLRIALLCLASATLVACGGDSNDDPAPMNPGPVDPGPVDPGPVDPGPVNPGPTDPGPTDPGSAPPLTAADRNSVSPCPEQAILTDAAELAALKEALLNGALTFRDVPFDSSDPDNFKKKCGFETFWDPANNINDVTPANVGITAITLGQLFSNGNAGICANGAMPNSNIQGLPAAGTYRTEVKVASGPSSWHLRLRSTVSGSSAGNEFVAESISVPADIENTLEYKVNGTVTAHDDVFAAIVNAVATNGEAVTLDVSKTAGGPSVLSVAIELICASKR